MKKLFWVVCLMCVGFGGVAAEEDCDGGMVKIGGEGNVALVASSRIPDDTIDTIARRLGGMLMVKVVHRQGAWSLEEAEFACEKYESKAVIFIVSDEAYPMSLVALESRWAIVNAVRLQSSDAGLFARRLQKEVFRVASALLGGSSSKYKVSVMRGVFSVEDLDKRAGDVITFDLLMNIFNYMPQMGLKQYEVMSYRDACEEGLAPVPTNDVQRAIWEKTRKQLAK